MNKYTLLTLVLTLWIAGAGVASAATLSVSPATASYQSGSTFTVSVLLNTSGASIDGVDVHYLHFNPAVLQVVGTKVTAGTLMSSTLTNVVNNQTGTIDFSQLVSPGQHYAGSGTLFTVTFNAVSGGSSSLDFDFTLGKTTDCNVASAGTDILSSVTDGQITVSGAVVTTSTLFNRLLSIGSTGADVTALQKYLGVITTGYFGSLTQAAVGNFQVQYGITTAGSAGYGQVGPLTRAKLNALLSGTTNTAPVQSNPSIGTFTFTRLLSLGSSNSDVTALQQLLAKDPTVYPQGIASGYFGSLTQAAVEAFQLKYSITTAGSAGYGQVGPLTRAKLNALLNQ